MNKIDEAANMLRSMSQKDRNKAIEISESPKTIKVHGIEFEFDAILNRPKNKKIIRNWWLVPRPDETCNAVAYRNHNLERRIGLDEIFKATRLRS